jgi:hypothetical protein
VLHATGTYLCSGACISTGLCCKDGDNDDEPGCPANTACDSVASATGAACVCDSDAPACCAIGDDCPLPIYPNGFFCTVVATPGGDDGICAAGVCDAGKTFARGC